MGARSAPWVGAIADWFVVVALFRPPLGLQSPRTAIIPSNKDRVGANLADCICAYCLGTEQVPAKLQRFDAGARVAHWLATPRNAARSSGHLAAALSGAFRELDVERVRGLLRQGGCWRNSPESTWRGWPASCSRC